MAAAVNLAAKLASFEAAFSPRDCRAEVPVADFLLAGEPLEFLGLEYPRPAPPAQAMKYITW